MCQQEVSDQLKVLTWCGVIALLIRAIQCVEASDAFDQVAH